LFLGKIVGQETMVYYIRKKLKGVCKMENLLKRFESNFSSVAINGEKYIFLVDFYDGMYGKSYCHSYYSVFAYNVENGRIWELRYYFDKLAAQYFNEPIDYIDYIDWSMPDEIILCENFDVEDFRYQLPRED
jgi:hypothetical protein